MKTIKALPILKMTLLLSMITDCSSLPLGDEGHCALVASSQGSAEQVGKPAAASSDAVSINQPGSVMSSAYPSQVRVIGPRRPSTHDLVHTFGQLSTDKNYENAVVVASPVIYQRTSPTSSEDSYAANGLDGSQTQKAAAFFEELVELINDYAASAQAIKSLLYDNQDSIQQGYITFINGAAYTALHYLAGEGATELVQYLIEEVQLDPDMYNGDAEMTALQYAAYKGYLDTVMYLIGQGASLTHKDRQNKSVMFYAVTGGHLRIATCLIESGVSMDAADHVAHKGFNLLHTAIIHNGAYFVAQLLELMEDNDVDVHTMANQCADLADWAMPLSLADKRYGKDNLVSRKLQAIIQSGNEKSTSKRKRSEHGELV